MSESKTAENAFKEGLFELYEDWTLEELPHYLKKLGVDITQTDNPTTLEKQLTQVELVQYGSKVKGQYFEFYEEADDYRTKNKSKAKIEECVPFLRHLESGKCVEISQSIRDNYEQLTAWLEPAKRDFNINKVQDDCINLQASLRNKATTGNRSNKLKL